MVIRLLGLGYGGYSYSELSQGIYGPGVLCYTSYNGHDALHIFVFAVALHIFIIFLSPT